MGVTHDCIIDPVPGRTYIFEVSDEPLRAALEQFACAVAKKNG